MSQKKLYRLVFFLSALLIIDRLSKLVSLRGGIPIRLSFFSFSPTINADWVFGFINNYILITWLITLLLLFIVMALVLALKKNQLVATWGWGLILIGGASNYWDRLWYGGVIDFINFLSISQFNLSDLYLIVGLFILLLNIKLIYVS